MILLTIQKILKISSWTCLVEDATSDADKLNICQVDLGEEEPVQIVCGAQM